jgi:hypothetical protein
MLDTLLWGGSSAELARVDELVATWQVGALPEDLKALQYRVAQVRWRRGDVAGADALAASLGHVANTHNGVRPDAPQRIAGIVVDEAGKPVPGADVVASVVIDSDSSMAAAPLELVRDTHTRTGADGTFDMPAARGLVVASSGALRSAFAKGATGLRIVLQPTVHVDGKVDLRSLEPAQVRVMIAAEAPGLWDAIAPVRADGTFSIDGVLRGKMWIAARPYAIDVGDEPLHIDVTGDVHGIALVAQPARPLHILARSATMTPPDTAVVVVIEGELREPHPTMASLKGHHVVGRLDARQPRDGTLPDVAKSRRQPDDLFATLVNRPKGPLTICTFGVTKDALALVKSPDDFQRIFGDVELTCANATTEDQVVVVEVAPMRKPRLP